MPKMGFWFYELANRLALICRERGIGPEDRTLIERLLHEEADIDRAKKKLDRWGAAYVIDAYTPKVLQRFITIVSKAIVSEIENPTPKEMIPPPTDIVQAVLSLRMKGEIRAGEIEEIVSQMIGVRPDGVPQILDSRVVGGWCDLLIRYRDGTLKDIFKRVINWPSIMDIITKPENDFGVFTGLQEE